MKWPLSTTQMIIIFFATTIFVMLYVVYKVYQHPKAPLTGQESIRKKIVFFGDSHIHGRIGDDVVMALQIEMPHLEMVNLGNNGDVAADLLGRIDGPKKLSPEQIYILVGSNDVFECQTCQSPPSEFQDQYKKLVESLAPNTKLFVISIPMIGDDENDFINTKIRQHNRVIANISAIYGVKYLPLYEKMAATIKALKVNKKQYDHPSFSRAAIVGIRRYLLGQELSSIAAAYGFALTVDGLHFNREGSQILMSLIIPELPL